MRKLLIAVSILLIASPAFAAERWWVNRSGDTFIDYKIEVDYEDSTVAVIAAGDDANPGTSPLCPKATMNAVFLLYNQQDTCMQVRVFDAAGR